MHADASQDSTASPNSIQGAMTKIGADSPRIVESMNCSTLYLWADDGRYTQREVVKVLNGLDVCVALISNFYDKSMDHEALTSARA